MKLKATKKRLYNLVLAHYPDVPPMRQTEFTKAPRSRSWWLKFDMPDGRNSEAYFSAVCGRVLLSFSFDCGYSRKVQKITIEELKKFDLLEGEKSLER